jgi:sulfatase modifying factor 1
LLPEVGRVTDPKGWETFPFIQNMIIAEPGPDSFTVAVGRYKPNAFGLHDMHGNVWEWCSDWYDDYPRSAVDDPQGPARGEVHARRGGGWNTFPMWGRSCSRNYATGIKNRICNLGFRVVREIAVSDSPSR